MKDIFKITTATPTPIAFHSCKRVDAESRYTTRDQEPLVATDGFKTWRYMFGGAAHKVLVLSDHLNVRQFLPTKALKQGQA